MGRTEEETTRPTKIDSARSRTSSNVNRRSVVADAVAARSDTSNSDKARFIERDPSGLVDGWMWTEKKLSYLTAAVDPQPRAISWEPIWRSAVSAVTLTSKNPLRRARIVASRLPILYVSIWQSRSPAR